MNEILYLSLQRTIKQSVLKAFVYAGYKNYSEDEINIIAEASMKWLENNGKGMDTEDIQNAIEYGSMGEFGEYIGISAVQVIQWLKTWKYSPKRFQSKRTVEVSKQLAEKAPLTESEQRQKDIEWVEKAKKTPNYRDYGHILYNALFRLGYLTNDLTEIEKAAQEVREDKINEGRQKVALMEMGSGQLIELISEVNKSPLERFKSEIRHKRVEWWLKENKI